MNYTDNPAMKTLGWAGLGFMSGVVVGVLAGALLAPQPGKQTREQLKGFASDAKDKVGRLAAEAKDTVHAMTARGKRLAG